MNNENRVFYHEFYTGISKKYRDRSNTMRLYKNENNNLATDNNKFLISAPYNPSNISIGNSFGTKTQGWLEKLASGINEGYQSISDIINNIEDILSLLSSGNYERGSPIERGKESVVNVNDEQKEFKGVSVSLPENLTFETIIFSTETLKDFLSSTFEDNIKNINNKPVLAYIKYLIDNICGTRESTEDGLQIIQKSPKGEEIRSDVTFSKIPTGSYAIYAGDHVKYSPYFIESFSYNPSKEYTKDGDFLFSTISINLTKARGFVTEDLISSFI